MNAARMAGLASCLVAALVATTGAVRAGPAGAPAETVRIEAYLHPGCPHCAAAREFLVALDAGRDEVSVEYHDVSRNEAARRRLAELTPAGHRPAVPTLLVAGRVFVGFAADGSDGERILAWLDRRVAEDALRRTVDLPFVGPVSAATLGLPAFALALGALDGFNPCATWVLLFLLALLLDVADRRRVAWVAGTFVLASGAVYYALLAAWLNVFLLMGWSRAAQLVLGAFALTTAALNLKDAWTPGRGPSLSIPEAAKPGLYRMVRRIIRAETLAVALPAAALLAVLVNLVELLCTAGLPAIFTQVLAAQKLGWPAYHGYLGLYLLAYLADDVALLVVALTTLRMTRLQARAGRALKLLSSLVMLALGLALVFSPERLMLG